MIVDRLVLHHTYEGSTAFDVSQNHHHGVLEHVTSGGGSVEFAGGPACVRVRSTTTLKSMRAVRTTVRFRWDPTGPPRRHNLIEGYLSFALVIEGNGALHGTILDRSGIWGGANSAPGVVSPGAWHEATFVHDGISACRVDLDGTTVAQAFDVIGPGQGVQAPYGVAIGHWPDPDDRYTFEGAIDDVRVWIDRPDAVRELSDSCCCDRTELIDASFDRLRAEGLDAKVYRTAAETLYDLGSQTFGQMAAGTEADRVHAFDLARRFTLAVKAGDRQSLADALDQAGQLAQAKIAPSELADHGAAFLAALQPTLIGPILDSALRGGNESSPEHLHDLMTKLGIDQWMNGFCLNWAMPPANPKGRERPTSHPDHSTDPTTDHGSTSRPPSWGGDHPEQHDNGEVSDEGDPLPNDNDPRSPR